MPAEKRAARIMAWTLAMRAMVGLFFGIYPAFSASRLNPIEALHHE